MQDGQRDLTRQLEDLKKATESTSGDASLYVDGVTQMIASVKVKAFFFVFDWSGTCFKM